MMIRRVLVEDLERTLCINIATKPASNAKAAFTAGQSQDKGLATVSKPIMAWISVDQSSEGSVKIC